MSWKRYEDEVPGRRINNIWPTQISPTDKRYVIQTATKAIQRCTLMTTDPGDLVFDPTCGSGTTPFVAEQWVADGSGATRRVWPWRLRGNA